jgi:C4-dicarboxylate-specific signal transduction histidine kinase
VLAAGLTLASAVHLRLRAAERRNQALSREISERQRAEEESHRHLLALAHVGRLATAGELTASLAHDLGQPLTAIVASAEATKMLLAGPKPDHAHLQEVLSSISEQGRRASEVIRGLRRFLGRGTPEFTPVDMNEVVREVTTLLHSTLLTDRVRLELRLDDGLPLVLGDRIPLQQVVMNLALNAIEIMRDMPEPQRRILVRSRQTARGVRVAVVDNGPGLGKGLGQKVFEPFHTTKQGGMGMGLAICRSIVEAHGGTIHGRNCPRGGAVFSFNLPAVGQV